MDAHLLVIELKAARLAMLIGLQAAARPVVKMNPNWPAEARDPQTGRWVVGGGGGGTGAALTGLARVFGDKPEGELDFHGAYFADAPAALKGLIGRTGPLGSIVYSGEGDGSFFQPSTNEISLRQGMSYADEAATWRHEYGHALDAAHGQPSARLGEAIQADRELLAGIEPLSDEEFRSRALRKADYLLSLKGVDREHAARRMTAGDPLGLDDLKGMANLDMSNTHHVRLLSILHAYSSTGYLNGYVDTMRKLLPLTDEHRGMLRMSVDYIHAATGGKIGSGHTEGYYAQNWGTIGSGVNRAHALESFANHIAIAGSPPEVAAIHSKLVSAIVPNTWDTTESILAGIVH